MPGAVDQLRNKMLSACSIGRKKTLESLYSGQSEPEAYRGLLFIRSTHYSKLWPALIYTSDTVTQYDGKKGKV